MEKNQADEKIVKELATFVSSYIIEQIKKLWEKSQCKKE